MDKVGKLVYDKALSEPFIPKAGVILIQDEK